MSAGARPATLGSIDNPDVSEEYPLLVDCRGSAVAVPPTLAGTPCPMPNPRVGDGTRGGGAAGLRKRGAATAASSSRPLSSSLLTYRPLASRWIVCREPLIPRRCATAQPLATLLLARERTSSSSLLSSLLTATPFCSRCTVPLPQRPPPPSAPRARGPAATARIRAARRALRGPASPIRAPIQHCTVAEQTTSHRPRRANHLPPTDSLLLQVSRSFRPCYRAQKVATFVNSHPRRWPCAC